MKKLLLIFPIIAACSSNPHYKEGLAHHTPQGFRNVHAYESPGFWDFWKWRWQAMFKDIPGPEAYDFPLAKNDPEKLQNNRDLTSLTWVGHANFLLQHKGLNILTDPQFSQRASPVQWIGPQRVVKPGLSFEDLPPIDAVVISHDHYDSLDVDTIKKLFSEKGGDKITFIAPLGFKDWFKSLGVTNVVGLDWNQSHKIGEVEFVATPVQHWGKRTLFDAYERLWAGWVIRSKEASFYFVGDTGYSLHFKEVGKRYGPFDISLIPIGAYEPRWFMNSYHVDPMQSVLIHKDIGSKKSIAMHWGTFILTDEALDLPPKELKEALEKEGVDPASFEVWQHGESYFYDDL